MRVLGSWGVLGTALCFSAAAAAQGVSESSAKPSFLEGVSKYVGATYFTFFDGPGVGEPVRFSPSSLARPSDTGWSVWTNLSVRAKFTKNLAADYQFRLQQIVTNDLAFRSQGGRLGLSGTLLSLETEGMTLSWSGAVNSDLPMVGQINAERKLLLNPGLFTQLSVKPKGSRFSLYALVSPRFWFYEDATSMSQQDLQGGLQPGQKPQYTLSFQPSINYAFNEKQGLRAGVLLDIRKNVSDPALRRWFWPVDIGYTHEFGKGLSIYPHVRVSGPWDDGLRAELQKAPEPWWNTLSFGMWLSGTIL